MSVLGRLLESPRLVAAAQMLRASMWRARGARLGAGCRFGSGTLITKPWRLEAGPRCEFERFSYLKIVREEAALSLGECCFVGYGSEINVSLRITIGSNVLIAPHCFITDHYHNFAPGLPIAAQGCKNEAVTIGDDVWLGAGVVVLPWVTIHSGAVVGAGAVVVADVTAGTVVAGVPARVLHAR